MMLMMNTPVTPYHYDIPWGPDQNIAKLAACMQHAGLQPDDYCLHHDTVQITRPIRWEVADALGRFGLRIRRIANDGNS
jgi:hypothetical protein